MKNGIYTVDKIQNDVIRLEMRENQEIFVLPESDISDLAADIKEGDIIEIVTNLFGKIKSIKVLEDMTKNIKEENSKKLDGLFDN